MQLAETIKETGLIAPVSGRQKDNGRFDLVTGERPAAGGEDRLHGADLAARPLGASGCMMRDAGSRL